jgi:hypothetical protein
MIFKDWKRALWRAPLHLLMGATIAPVALVMPPLGRRYVRWRTRAEQEDMQMGRDTPEKAEIDLYTQTIPVRLVLKIWGISILICVSAFAQLPDRRITPGVIRTSNSAEICAKKFRTKPFRKTTLAMKQQACKAYGITGECPSTTGAFEIDHLIPLETGGADDVANLWPQLALYPDGPGFHTKDVLENQLKKQVCSGKLTLPDAQSCIAQNWIACYQRIYGVAPK